MAITMVMERYIIRFIRQLLIKLVHKQKLKSVKFVKIKMNCPIYKKINSQYNSTCLVKHGNLYIMTISDDITLSQLFSS